MFHDDRGPTDDNMRLTSQGLACVALKIHPQQLHELMVQLDVRFAQVVDGIGFLALPDAMKIERRVIEARAALEDAEAKAASAPNHYWYLLDRAGVHIATVAQGRLNFGDLGSYLSATVTQHGKAQFLRDSARNSVRGQRRVMSEGRWIGGVPFGYQLVAGRLALGDADAVAAVRRIFDLRVKGYGLKRIVAMLDSEGIRSPRGKRWNSVSVRHILDRVVYRGDTEYGKHSTGRFEKVATEPTTTRDTHPAIIDRETWAIVHGMKKIKRRANGRGGEGAPLAGLVKCGKCGGPMYARTVGKAESYLCASYSQKGKCGHCAVHRGPLLKAIATKLRQHLLMGSPEQLERAIQKELDRRREPTIDTKATAKKLATLDRQIERASGRLLIVDEALVPDLQKQLLALKDRRAQLAATAEPSAKRLPSAKAIAARLWELDRILAEAPATTIRAALAEFVSEIRLDFEELPGNYRGRRFGFVGGTIRFCTEGRKEGGRNVLCMCGDQLRRTLG
jgi:hypothetical protein